MNRLHIQSIEEQVNGLVLQNRNQDSIYRFLKWKLDKDNKPALNDEELEMLESVVNDVITEHPNYELRQKIVNCELLMDGKGKGAEFILFSPATNAQWIQSKESLKCILSKPEIDGKVRHCNMIWNPYGNIKLQAGKNGWWVCNTYEPPTWIGNDFFMSDFKFPKSELPEIYDKFLNHLVDNDKESYEYILDWLATAMQPDKRNFCILTTIGQQGIGKGILGQIMEKLVGTNNFSLTTQKAISGTFNKQLRNKIIVYINEVEVKTVQDENRLKGYIDETIEIEAKHVDAETVVNHGNLYLSTNNEDALRLTADDRRFSIVSLTKTKINDTYFEKLSGHTITELLDKKHVKQFGNYLMNRRVDDRKMTSPLKTKLTEEIREASLKRWEFDLIENLYPKYCGRTVKLDKISKELEEKFGQRHEVGPNAIKKLIKLYPEKLKLTRPRDGESRYFAIVFLKGE